MRAFGAATAFRYELKRVENRLMIEGKCLHCGASKIVSSFDGSLAQWEEEHDCRDEGDKPNSKKGKLISFGKVPRRRLISSRSHAKD